MMGTEIFKIDASWAEKLTKTRVSFLMTPTVDVYHRSCIVVPAQSHNCLLCARMLNHL